MVGRLGLLAGHGPRVRWVDPDFVVGARLAIVAGSAMILLADRRRRWSPLQRAAIGIGAVLATLPMNTLWSGSERVGLLACVGALLLVSPFAVAVVSRSLGPTHLVVIVWWALVALGSGLMVWIKFGASDWDNSNDWRPAYVAYVIAAVALIVGLWIIGWGTPPTRPYFRFRNRTNGGASTGRSFEQRIDRPAVTSPLAVSLGYARVIRSLSWVSLLVAVVLIATVLLAPPAVVLVLAAMAIRRATSAPLKLGDPWPTWAPSADGVSCDGGLGIGVAVGQRVQTSRASVITSTSAGPWWSSAARIAPSS